MGSILVIGGRQKNRTFSLAATTAGLGSTMQKTMVAQAIPCWLDSKLSRSDTWTEWIYDVQSGGFMGSNPGLWEGAGQIGIWESPSEGQDQWIEQQSLRIEQYT